MHQLGFQSFLQLEQQHHKEVAQVLGYLLSKEIINLAFAGFDLKTLQERFASTTVSTVLEEKMAIGKNQTRVELLSLLL